MNKTSIIIITYNNLEYNKACIESIRSFTEKGTYEIIVVDNNSTDGTVEWLKSQTDLKVIYNDYNAGFPKACNQGIEAACKENDILLLHNDTIVTKNWLENLRECLYSDDSVGAVSPVTNMCSYNQAIATNFSSFDEMFEFARQYNTNGQKEYEQRIKLIDFCILIKREAVDKVGLLDERFTPGYYEDDDYSYRIIEAGFKLLLCKSTFIFHFGNTSFNDRQALNELLAANSKKFEEKWGFRSEYSSNMRPEVVNLINADKDSAINVLEIGCACGAMLLKIKNDYKNASLYGVELNKNAAKIAAHIADVRGEDIEKASLSYDEEFFDYIIFADVLEHLYDPEKVLNNMKKYLKKGGYIIASIPNVMHFSIMAGLLNGDFTYQDSGILDRTHIRFFTLKEITKLFSRAGYSSLDYYSITQGGSENYKDFIDKLVAISGEDKREQFLAFQYFIRAKKQ